MVRKFKTTAEKVDDLLWLVNNVSHVIPARLGQATELCPAIVYSDSDDEPKKLYLGEPNALVTLFPHAGISEEKTPHSVRRISAVTVLSDSGINLAVDGDRTKYQGGLEAVRADLGEEFDEIFIGGYTEVTGSSVEAQTLCTTGLIREVSKYIRLGEANGLDREQTKFAIGLSVSQLVNGLPMPDLEVIEMAKFS